MNDLQARQFVEMLAAPEPAAPPACPLCGRAHALERPCRRRAARVGAGRSPRPVKNP